MTELTIYCERITVNRTLKIASLIYATSILLSRVIGLIRESVIGRTLGDQPEADVYWLAFVLPDFLNYLLAHYVLLDHQGFQKLDLNH